MAIPLTVTLTLHESSTKQAKVVLLLPLLLHTCSGALLVINMGRYWSVAMLA